MASIDDDLRALAEGARFDQTAAAMATMAGNLVTYSRALTDAGMTPVQAFVLSRDLHFLTLAKSFWPDRPPAFGGEK